MKFRTLNENWDWQFGRGANDYAQESLAIAYDIKSRLLSWYGDCFFALTEGIDWKNRLGSKRQKENLDGDAKKVIATTNGVAEIEYFESSLFGRTYNLVTRVKTIYGDTIEVRI